MALTDDECEPLLATSDRPIYCASNTCRNCSSGNSSKDSSAQPVHFYRFPRDAARCKQWIDNCGNRALLGKSVADACLNNYLCILHFTTSQFESGEGSRRLIPDAVPTLFTPVNVHHLLTDHDYLSVSLHCEQPSPKAKPPTVVRVAKPRVSILKHTTTPRSQDTPGLSTAASENSAAVSTLSTEQPRSGALTQARGTAKAAPMNAVVPVPHRKPQTAGSQRKPPPQPRRIAPTSKETPLQKYMLLCAELKGQLKSIQKCKGPLEHLFSGLQELLVKEAELLNMEDGALLLGSLVKFLRDRYSLEPKSSAEKTLCTLWQNHQQKLPHVPKRRPFAQVAVFVTDKSKPGYVVLGKRKEFVGGGLYQVPCGEIEFGETWEEAARREVLESVAMYICDLKVCSVVDSVEATIGYHAVTVFVRSAVDASRPTEPRAMQPDRSDSWHWRLWHELPSSSELYWPLRDYKMEGLHPFT